MSSNRRHTDVNELGWLDLMAACAQEPILRVQGRICVPNEGRMKRYNRSVRIHPETSTKGKNPTVQATRVRWSKKLAIWLDTDETMTLEWNTVDWLSWKATGDPNGTWCKVTTTGKAVFGHLEVRDASVYDTTTEVARLYPNRGLAVIAAIRQMTA
jgi:hypothetical protein